MGFTIEEVKWFFFLAIMAHMWCMFLYNLDHLMWVVSLSLRKYAEHDTKDSVV